jgi:hypothetical protein
LKHLKTDFVIKSFTVAKLSWRLFSVPKLFHFSLITSLQP